jgi:hypothetical protein
MDFLVAEPLMLKYGITPKQIDDLKALAAKLPADIVDGTTMPVPKMPGLSASESELLMARMLDAIAPLLGAPVEDPYLLDELGLPTMQELMTIANQRQQGARQRRQDLGRGSGETAKKDCAVTRAHAESCRQDCRVQSKEAKL